MPFSKMHDEESQLVLLHGSHWASNIGNPFFTLGAEHVLKEVFDEGEVLPTVQLSSAAWSPTDQQLERSLDYVQFSEPDWFVMCGPMMNADFVSDYEQVFEQMPIDEMNIMLLSVGSIDYNQAEVRRCRKFLERFPPTVFFTRDSWTYDRYHDLAEYSYDGIDLAFFTPDYYPGYPTPRLEPYVTVTFDKAPEPDIELTNPHDSDGVEVGPVRHGRLVRNILRRLPRSYPQELAGRTVIRPTHNVLQRSERSLYSKPNAFFAQTPYGYLNLYRNTELTLSDRVHACVPTLAYGNRAQLLIDTSRARLFERVGLDDITNQAMTMDLDSLEREKDNLVEELEQAVG